MVFKAEIDDTYAEAFAGIFCRVIITADDRATLHGAAEDSTATPSVVIGRVEGGVEKWLDEDATPDKREGAVLQFWAGLAKNNASLLPYTSLRLNFPTGFAKTYLLNPSPRSSMRYGTQRVKWI